MRADTRGLPRRRGSSSFSRNRLFRRRCLGKLGQAARKASSLAGVQYRGDPDADY